MKRRKLSIPSAPRLLRLAAAAGVAVLVTGCAVYPVGPAVYEQPTVVYPAAAPVVVAPPPPVYYGPVYPSVSIYGRFGGGWGGRRHYWRR